MCRNATRSPQVLGMAWHQRKWHQRCYAGCCNTAQPRVDDDDESLQPGVRVPYVPANGVNAASVARVHTNVTPYIKSVAGVAVAGDEGQTQLSRVRVERDGGRQSLPATTINSVVRGFITRRAVKFLVPSYRTKMDTDHAHEDTLYL